MTKYEQVLKGLIILRAYGTPELAVAHDQLWAVSDDAEVSDVDRVELDALGWFEDEDSWSIFI